MVKDMKSIRKDEHKTSNWSGGTTTQLYIYPENACYDKRDFLFRISSAKVEVEESVFTHLPGINREIMIIDGELQLEHEGYYDINLSRFDKDRFSGDWTTKSYGKVTDFNLMMNEGCDGNLEYIEVKKDSIANIELYKNEIYNNMASILYCVLGKVSIYLEESIDLCDGDLLVVITKDPINTDNISVQNKIGKDANLIISRVYF